MYFSLFEFTSLKYHCQKYEYVADQQYVFSNTCSKCFLKMLAMYLFMGNTVNI